MAKRTLSEFVGGLDVPASNSQHDALVKKTYYFRPDQLKALRVRAIQEDVSTSEMLRDAIDLYLNHQGEAQ